MNELALFAGAGGGILGGRLLGWRTVCAVEYDQYARDVLMARQNDGHLEPFPIWDDVRTFDGRPWQGLVDVVSGGFPCQDISSAGKGAGIEGARSGLWGQMARIIGEVRPRYVWVENSPLLVSRGLGLVLGDLAKMGFDARWGIVGANDAGAPHIRKRIWLLAYANCKGKLQAQGQKERRRISNKGMEHTDVHGQLTSTKRKSSTEKLREKQTGQDKAQYSTRASSLSVSREDVEDTYSTATRHKDRKSRANRRRTARRKLYAFRQKYRQKSANRSQTTSYGSKYVANALGIRLQKSLKGRTSDKSKRLESHEPAKKQSLSWWDRDPANCKTPESRVDRMVDGMAHRVDRIKALGNGQVPAVVALAWEILTNLE
jgi:DNA (cytosine-5)-methyltransferase 1